MREEYKGVCHKRKGTLPVSKHFFVRSITPTPYPKIQIHRFYLIKLFISFQICHSWSVRSLLLIDFTLDMIKELDAVARELNISRQAVIKAYLRQALDQHYLARQSPQ